jgi:hypothetical protein
MPSIPPTGGQWTVDVAGAAAGAAVDAAAAAAAAAAEEEEDAAGAAGGVAGAAAGASSGGHTAQLTLSPPRCLRTLSSAAGRVGAICFACGQSDESMCWGREQLLV